MDVLRKLECLLLILALSFPCFAKEEVKMKGRWDKDGRSITSELPIQAWLEDNNKDLLLEFSPDLGTVEVTVTNSIGEIVYSQRVVTQPSVVISLNEELTEGAMVTITDGRNLVYGEIFN